MIDLDLNGTEIKTDTDPGFDSDQVEIQKGDSKLVQKWGQN